MPSITFIPKHYREGFQLLSTLDDSTFSIVLEALLNTPLRSSVGRVVKDISANQSLPSESIEKILISVGSLVPFLDQGTPITELTEDIVKIINSNSFFDLPKDQKSGTFVDRLSVLLENQVLYYAAKANDLITDNSCVFIQARIITDIRPVFSASTEEQPKAGVIFHNLHIHYHSSNSDHRDIYLALDSNDIKSLQEILTRAEKKQLNLASFVSKTGMINLSE